MEAWYGYMRHLPYKWSDILEEECSRTFIGMDYLERELKHNQKKTNKPKSKRLNDVT